MPLTWSLPDELIQRLSFGLITSNLYAIINSLFFRSHVPVQWEERPTLFQDTQEVIPPALAHTV